MKKRNLNIAYVSLIVLIILLVSAYFMFVFTPSCKSVSCFTDSYKKCSKVSYINEDDTAIWQYKIRFSWGSSCDVNVKAVEIKSDAQSAIALDGKEMLCSIPKNMTIVFPEKQLQYCHGDLKESLQDLMIKRMQTYIIDALASANLTK